MSRYSLTARLLDILLLLADKPRTQTELAHIFKVSTRTIRDDMTVLISHAPIISEPSDEDARVVEYRYMDGHEFKPPQLMPAELAALLLAQESIARTGLTRERNAPLANASVSLIAKVRAALPEILRAHLDALAQVYGSSSVPAKDFAPHAPTIERLTAAALSNTRVRMTYHSLTSDKITLRGFDPYAVYFDPDGATLKTIGADTDNRRITTFAVDRIHKIEDTTETFTRPIDFDLHQYLTTYCFNGIHGQPVTVVLRATGTTARIFAERAFHPTQKIIARDTGKKKVESTTIEMTVAEGRGLERFILSYAPEVEVLSPPELRSRIAQLHTHAAATNLDAKSDGETSE